MTPSTQVLPPKILAQVANIPMNDDVVSSLVIECTASTDSDLFVKRVVLTFPHLQSNQILELKLESKAPLRCHKTADYFRKISSNVRVTVMNTATHPEDLRESDDPFLDRTENWLRSTGFVDPFEKGFSFPSRVPIELSDVGLDSDILARLEKEATSWQFHSIQHSPNENLGVMFILFKQLLADPDLPPNLLISDEQLLWVLCVYRSLYKPHVPFHSYWHAVDVTQFTIFFIKRNPETFLLDAAQKLSLAVAAAGHDALHPGLMIDFIDAVDPRFLGKYDSLETYHLEIFKNVLNQVWPAITNHWGHVVEAAIDATELSKHETYMQAPYNSLRLSMEHAIKTADLSSCLRGDLDVYYRCSGLIFLEFRNQSLLAKRMSDIKIPSQILDPSKPAKDEFVRMQERFLKNLAMPYFTWLNERVPKFTPFYESCKQHFEHLYSIKNGSEVPGCLEPIFSKDRRF